MTEKKLDEIIKLLASQKEKISKLYHLGIDAYEITDELYRVVDILLESQFKDKHETLFWYIHEDPDPPLIYSYDPSEEGKPLTNKKRKILYDFRKKGDLWRYLND
jgi:hypothetical protein